MFKKFWATPIDWILLIVPIILTISGVITIYTITFAQDKAGLAASQIWFASFGLIAMFVAMFTDYRWFKAAAGWLYVIGIILLLMLIPPIADKLPFTLKVFGAYRWLDLQFFQLQPGEIFKLIAALFSAKILSQHIGQIDWKKTVTFIILALTPFVLILIQPDLGTASVVLVVFAAAFLSARPSGRIVLAVFLAVVIALPILWANARPYQKNRVETFLNPSRADPQKEGYNVLQSIIAIGSGGLTGRGFGQGSQTVLNFLPVAHTDFIFSGFGEATGFVGSMTLIFLYVLLIYRALSIGALSTDKFGQLLAVAIAVRFLYQVTVHLSMNMGLLPVTGIPLPFMSHGGTSLIGDLISVGILQSIYIRHSRSALR